MTVTNSLTRQPTKLDYASPTQFKFSILKLPKVEYFCTSVNIPGINLGETTQATPLKKIPIPCDTLTYEPLQMTFLVDENLENFQEIHGWLVGIGFPRDNSEFRNLLTSGNDRFPTRNASNVSSEAGKSKYASSDTGAILSDARASRGQVRGQEQDKANAPEPQLPEPRRCGAFWSLVTQYRHKTSRFEGA